MNSTRTDFRPTFVSARFGWPASTVALTPQLMNPLGPVTSYKADESGLASNTLYPAELSGGQKAIRNPVTCLPSVSTPSFPGDQASRAKEDEDARNLPRSGRIAKPMEYRPEGMGLTSNLLHLGGNI